jgi:hypothetical protein
VVSLILTAVARVSLDATPFHAVSAKAPGTGKGKTVNVASVIATGRPCPVIAQGGDGVEFEKRLSTELLDGSAFVAIDNAEEPIGGVFLCQALTEPAVKPRVLGKSESPIIPNRSFITGTGNNLRVYGDMIRRSLVAKLDAKVERPELLKFDFDPVERAKERRPQLLVACLTILRAFRLNGAPSGKPALGSFEQWSLLVRDAILWLGLADPLDVMEDVREADPALADLTMVMGAWREVIGREQVTVAEVIKTASKREPPAGDFENEGLRDALMAIAGKGGAINSRALGHWLSKYAGRIVGGFRFHACGERHKVSVWRLSAD